MTHGKSAAAPELLAVARLALKTILDAAEARDFEPPADPILIAELEAAITKATAGETRNAEHTPSPQSVVVPLEDWRHVIGALKNAKARLPMGAAIGNVSDALSKVEHLQAAPATSSLAGGEVNDEWADRFCEAVNWSPEGQECKTVEGELRCTTFRQIAKGHILAAIATNPYPDNAALSPEAPAREGEGLDVLRDWKDPSSLSVERPVAWRWRRPGGVWNYQEDRQVIPGTVCEPLYDHALTPRHEAPAEPVSDRYKFDDEIAWLREAARYFSVRDTKGEDRAHWANVYNAENARKLADRLAELSSNPCQLEAPAEGAGEREALAAIMQRNMIPDDDGGFSFHDLKAADQIMDYLRARSSAPEAREREEAVGVVYSLKADLNTAELPDGTLLYTHPAHPSADKLRIAVEALKGARDPLSTAKMWGKRKGGCDGAVDKIDRALWSIKQALAALKAEGA